jgi:hypothetical protein
MRIGEEMQRIEKEQRIAQIYTQISVIMGNWKNRLKSHEVSLSAIWSRWERLAKQNSHQKQTQKLYEKKNQSLYTGSLNSIESFSTEKLSK